MTDSQNKPTIPTQLRFKRLHKDAVLPVRGSDGAVGYDLSCIEDVTIKTVGPTKIRTGWAVELPGSGSSIQVYGRVAPRSGLALKGIDVGAGVIDPDYRGEVAVIVFNHGGEDMFLKKGSRVAQLIIELVITPEPIEMEALSETGRGDNGFGSTGMGSLASSSISNGTMTASNAAPGNGVSSTHGVDASVTAAPNFNSMVMDRMVLGTNQTESTADAKSQDASLSGDAPIVPTEANPKTVEKTLVVETILPPCDRCPKYPEDGKPLVGVKDLTETLDRHRKLTQELISKTKDDLASCPADESSKPCSTITSACSSSSLTDKAELVDKVLDVDRSKPSDKRSSKKSRKRKNSGSDSD